MDQAIMGEITVASKAPSQFESLRTTIPMSVVRQLKIKAGDKLDWEFAFDGENMYIKLKKITE
jgi:hypothetical protein